VIVGPPALETPPRNSADPDEAESSFEHANAGRSSRFRKAARAC
jgi:hypothetical protein